MKTLKPEVITKIIYPKKNRQFVYKVFMGIYFKHMESEVMKKERIIVKEKNLIFQYNELLS